MGIQKLEDLEIYNIALDLADWVYDVLEEFPDYEKYNVIDQLRRSSSSVAANIAEGFGRYYYKENRLFCRRARGSLLEVKHWFIFSLRRDYIQQDKYDYFEKVYRNISVKLSNYINSLGAWDNKG